MLGHTAALQFFAKDEGIITNLIGLKKAQELESVYELEVHKKIGERAYYVKHGGKNIFHVVLFNKDRSKLLADIRRLEQMVKIETSPTNGHSKHNNKKKS